MRMEIEVVDLTKFVVFTAENVKIVILFALIGEVTKSDSIIFDQNKHKAVSFGFHRISECADFAIAGFWSFAGNIF